MNYSDLLATISNLTVISATDPDFVQIFPQAITYAENRIIRELDLLSTVTQASSNFIPGNRQLNLTDTGVAFVVVNGIMVYDALNNPFSPMTPVSKDFLDATYPSAAGSGLPKYYAPLNEILFVVGPWPDQAYTYQITGIVQPLSLSDPRINETWISRNLPDLLTAAVMIFMAGYQQNFGAQSDDPQMAQSWEGQYKTLVASANVVEQRKKFQSTGWGSLSPAPIATPNR